VIFALFSLPASLEISLFFTFLIFPFLAWTAFRFEMPGVSLAATLLAGVAVVGTSSGQINLLMQDSTLEAVSILQLSLAVIIIPSLLLAALVSERQTGELERRALLEIMQAANSIQDLPTFLKLIHQALKGVIYAENFSVVFYQKQSGLFEEVYAVDQYDEPMPPSSLEKSLTAYVFRSGQTQLVRQAEFDRLVAQGEVELVGTNSASWLGAPLKTASGSIGVVTIQSYSDPACYSNGDKVLLTSIASQVAMAIERKQAEDALARKVKEMERVLDLTVDRELLMAELKKEINSLLKQNGQPEKYRVIS
jgi:GAF domain-containing protein